MMSKNQMKLMKRRIATIIIAVTSILMTASCGGSEKPDPEVLPTGMIVSPTSLTLNIGETQKLDIKLLPENVSQKYYDDISFNVSPYNKRGNIYVDKKNHTVQASVAGIYKLGIHVPDFPVTNRSIEIIVLNTPGHGSTEDPVDDSSWGL